MSETGLSREVAGTPEASAPLIIDLQNYTASERGGEYKGGPV